MVFSDVEKIALFDKISDQYYNRNFGSMSKADFETLLFSEYIEHCINNRIPFDDYSISKQLGITQARVRTLKEKKELKYPNKEFNWKNNFAKCVENAKYDSQDHYVKILIQDVNVMNEVRNFIETKGWYDECSLNKKLLRIPLDCFIDICYKDELFDDVFSENTKAKVKKIAGAEKIQIKTLIDDFTIDGLKSFLMSASKELILEVLKQLPFGGIAKTAFEFLVKAIERS